MPEPSEPHEEPSEVPEDQRPGNAEVVALGIGCLVVLVFFGALALAAMLRN